MTRRFADIDLSRLVKMPLGLETFDAVYLARMGEIADRLNAAGKLKRPRILFEPHVFHRNLTPAQRKIAVAQGLAYAAWKPGAYGPESDQYPRLFRAMAINETAALMACSWGLGQILGENFEAAGYASPQAMVAALVDGGEAEHLAAMVRFIKASGLDDELRRHDWAGFAKGYNGAGYKANGYDLKLAASFAKWAKIPDTPFSPEPFVLAAPVSPAAPIPAVLTSAKCARCGLALAG